MIIAAIAMIAKHLLTEQREKKKYDFFNLNMHMLEQEWWQWSGLWGQKKTTLYYWANTHPGGRKGLIIRQQPIELEPLFCYSHWSPAIMQKEWLQKGVIFTAAQVRPIKKSGVDEGIAVCMTIWRVVRQQSQRGLAKEDGGQLELHGVLSKCSTRSKVKLGNEKARGDEQ